jgi:hypothetical protein
MFTYRITYLLGRLDTSTCPPAVVSVIFPAFNGEPVTLTESEITVTFKTEQTPIALSPLVRVELIQNDEAQTQN